MSIVSTIEAKLSGWPDAAITAGLLIVAAVAIGVALFGRPIIKPLVLAWMVAP